MHHLSLGQKMQKGDYIRNNIDSTLIFEESGHLALYDNYTYRNPENLIWISENTSQGEIVYFEENGNLVMYNKSGLKIWETKTYNTQANALIIDNYDLKIINIPAGRILVEDELHEFEVISKFKPNRNLFESPIKLGVVLIGSLLWQNNGSKDESNLRKNWRDRNFIKENNLKTIPVKFPIRYGRMSEGDIYTMVISEEFNKTDKLGTAILLHANEEFQSLHELLSFANKLALAEGMTRNKEPRTKLSWGFISYAINPNSTLKNNKALISHWEKLASKDNYFENFKVNSELSSSISKNGSLKFLDNNWLVSDIEANNKIINNLDIVLTTVTRPRYKKKPVEDFSKYPDIIELRANVDNDKTRYYFYNNLINGIETSQDKIILELNDKLSSTNLPFDLKKGEFKRINNYLFYFSTDGRLQLYNLKKKKFVWSTTIYERGNLLSYQDDGNLVIYDGKNVVWSADIYSKKGIGTKTTVLGFDKKIEIFENNIILSVTNRKFCYVNNFGQEFFFTDIDLECKILLDN